MSVPFPLLTRAALPLPLIGPLTISGPLPSISQVCVAPSCTGELIVWVAVPPLASVIPTPMVNVLEPPMVIGADVAANVMLFTDIFCPRVVFVVPGLARVKKMSELAVGRDVTSVDEPLAIVQL